MIAYENNRMQMLLTYDTIKNDILGIKNDASSLVLRNLTKEKIRRTKNIINISEDIKNDDSVIFSMVLNNTMITLISSYKKQKIPISYIYIDKNNGYILLIMKVISVFPIIMLKLPINENDTYVNKNLRENICFEFPMNQLNLKQYKNKNTQYQLTMRNAETLQLEFFIKNNQLEKNAIISSIKSVNMESVNLLFTIDIENIMKHTIKDPIVNFDMSYIMMVHRVNNINENITLNTNRCKSMQTFIALDGQKMDFIHVVDNYREQYTICTKENALYWNFGMNAKIFNIEKYDNVFKLNYAKLTTTKQKLYYVILSYADLFLFVKIVYSGAVELFEKKGYTFIDVFNNHREHILEIYVLTSD